MRWNDFPQIVPGRNCGRALPTAGVTQATWLGAEAKAANGRRPALEGRINDPLR